LNEYRIDIERGNPRIGKCDLAEHCGRASQRVDIEMTTAIASHHLSQFRPHQGRLGFMLGEWRDQYHRIVEQFDEDAARP